MTYEEYSNLFLIESKIPCEKNNISGPCCGLSTSRRMLYVPWEKGQTMENVTTLTPRFLDSDNTFLGYYYPRIQMTSNYVFIERYNDDNRLCRYSIKDFSKIVYNPDTLTNNFLFSAVYSDNVIYTLETRFEDPIEILVIYKITLNSGGVQEKEEIYSWLAEDESIDGYIYWDPYFFGLIKNENNDCIVNIWTYLGSETEYNYLWKIVIHHINTNTTSEQWVIPSDDMNADLYNVFYMSTTPSFYDSKLIFTTIIEAPYDIPGPPYGSHCLFPVYIIDINNDSVTVINNHKYDLDEDWIYVSTGGRSLIDYTNGTFYFPAWIEPNFSLGYMYLFSMDINTQQVVMGNICSTELECHQSMLEIYAIDNDSAPGSCSVIEIPSQTVVTYIDTLLSKDNNVLENLASIDIDNNMIWNITSSNLQGKSLIGGEDRDITINWSGGSIPFQYETNREVWIRILDGTCVVMVYSRSSDSPYSYQLEYYLLKES